MGKYLDSAGDDNRTIVKSSTCLEIVGPPAAGKTTLARELKNRHDRSHLRIPPDWKQLRHFPFYAKNILSLTPYYVSLIFGDQGRWLKLEDEFFGMVFLNGWHHKLTSQSNDRSLTILDQGPVFMLGMMILYREGQLRNPFLKEWWNRILEKWRHVLDTVILLDASDKVLTHRINTREQDHRIKGASFLQAQDFLEKRRKAFDKAINLLNAGHCTLRVISFDTSRQSLSEVADRVLWEFESNENRSNARNLQS